MVDWPNVVGRLWDGETVTLRPKGQSMTPRIQSGQEVILVPARDGDIEVGRVVLAKVKGRNYLHLISAMDGDRVQISNNHGHVNGWTHRSKVYGLAVDANGGPL